MTKATTVINMSSLTVAERRLLMQNRLVGYKYIGRSRYLPIGKWGNTYSHLLTHRGQVRVGSREEAVRRHREDTLADPTLVKKIKKELKGMILVCWCAPLACHGNTLAEIADS